MTEHDLDRSIFVVYPDPKKLPPAFRDVQFDSDGLLIDLIKETVTLRVFITRMQGLPVVDTVLQLSLPSVTLETEQDVMRWIDTGQTPD